MFNSIIDFFGHLVGKIEDVVHGPIYPIDEYEATVDLGKLYRGTWPDAKLLYTLKKQFGVMHVINLCKERFQDDLVKACGMNPLNVPIEDNYAPTDQNVTTFLYLLTCLAAPAYVHCEAGKGRTGCMAAAYRVRVQHWSKHDALQEAEKFGLTLPCQKGFILSL